MAKANWKCPNDWTEWSKWLAAGLHARNRWRLPVLLTGILFAVGLRTVTSWLRAVGVSDDFQDYYYFLAALGRKTASVATQLFLLLLRTLPLPDRLLVVIDDSPTKRYGPKVEGADIHHNPTPGPADQKYLYGHIWVTLSLALRHPLWGALALPLRAMLYVRQKTIPTIPRKRGWRFRTKLELAAHLVEWIATLVKKAGKTLWVVVDGGYTKEPFLKPAMATGTTVIGRLRKDAALRDLPAPLRPGQRRGRGRPPVYGKNRISLAKRAGHKQGWQTIECTAYGKTTTKTYKTFLATYEPVGGVIHVVIVKEEHDWFPFFSTDPTRAWSRLWKRSPSRHDQAGLPRHQGSLAPVNNKCGTSGRTWPSIISICGCIHWWNSGLGTALHRRKPCDRSDSPWDDPERRPSHADRRKAFRRHILQTELSAITVVWSLPPKIIGLAQRLMNVAT